ncbi:MAG: Gfo/Idh/MocA family oxidoreductase [Planctomycetaceae bacterium]|nr:Gfo/Idh/MocA family oxidoreductase [Planctomycetaceae bacterium]
MKRAKIGLIGLGRQGEQHAINLATRVQGADLVAICDMNEAKLNEVADRYAIPHRVKTFEDLVAIKELDAIAIISPSVFHAKHIEQALAAGKHVFSEKPLGVTMDECIATKKVVEQYPDRLFMLGFMRRFDASYRYAQQKIANGDIGRVVLFRAYSQDPIKYIKGAIAYGPTSGGQFLDMSVHDIDLARWMVGSEPEQMWAIGGCYAYPEFGSYKDGDNVSALMKFKDGAMGFLFAGRTANHGYNIETEIIGTKATLRIASVPQANLVEILDEHGVRKECHDNFLERFELAYVNEMQEFVNCLNEGRKPPVGVEDGYRASLVAYKCREAFETGNLVTTGL